MSIEPSPAPFTDEDARQLAELLARYAAQELDQFETWQVETPHGSVFIFMASELPPGWPAAESFQTIWPLPARLQK
jgi:hypothetical protein